MKIKHLLLLLLLALCAPTVALAQTPSSGDYSVLTINGGSNLTNYYVPIYEGAITRNTKCQFIIPASSLTELAGSVVKKLTFYCSNASNRNWGAAQFNVYMAEVTNTVFTSGVLVNWGTMDLMYSGSLSIVNGLLVVDFGDNEFLYEGGNLMIGFEQTASGTYPGQNIIALWTGVPMPTFSALSVNTTNTGTRPYPQYFLPKLTFDYIPTPYPAVVSITHGDITATTAEFSWPSPSPNVTGYAYQCKLVPSEEWPAEWEYTTNTSIVVSGLMPIADYDFRLKALYGAHESSLIMTDFTTGCPEYVSIPYYENFDRYHLNSSAVSDPEQVLPQCWDWINNSTYSANQSYPTMFYNYFSASNPAPYANSVPNCMLFNMVNVPNYLDGTDPQPQYAILPQMQNINRLRVRFNAKRYSDLNYYSSTLTVGVMEGTDPSTFTPVGTVTATSTNYEPYTVDLNNYVGTGNRIAIVMEIPNHYYGCVFIDDVVVEELPQFTMPVPAHGEVTGGWCLISSPLAEAVNPVNVSQLVADDAHNFDLYRFNPNPGITGSNWENWKNHANNDLHYHFDLVPGRGYLYANANDVNLGFNGAPYEGNGEVTLQYDEDAHFGGWNLVGNPFPVSTYIGDRAYYRMNEEGTDFVPVSDGSAIRAMEGIFVYTETDGEVVTFSTTPTATRGEQLSFNVSKVTRAGLSTTFDRAILRFGEGDALPKFQLNEASAKVYIPQNGMDYAVATAEGQGEMPVNFRADENGTYTLSFSIDNIEFSYLHLFDNKTGTDVDLLSTPSYTFNATTTDYESRFKLVYATGSSVAGDSFSFFNSNGNFSIFGIEGEATLQVYDVMGRVLSTETFSGSIEKQLNVAPGVYFIRLVNGDDVKTQKIVVR